MSYIQIIKIDCFKFIFIQFLSFNFSYAALKDNKKEIIKFDSQKHSK